MRAAFGNSDLTNLRPKFSKIYSGLLWSDQWQSDREDRLSWENRIKSMWGGSATKPKHCVCAVCVCVCACPFYKCLSMFVWHSCPQMHVSACHRRRNTYTSSLYRRLPLDWQWRNRLVMPQSSTVAATSNFLSIWVSACWLRSPSGCLSVTYAPPSAQDNKYSQGISAKNSVSEGVVLLLMMPILERLVGVYSHCLLVPLPRTIPLHQTASDGWLN